MACSEELRIPKEWSKYHHNIKNEPVDPELFSEYELFAWVRELDLCHDKSVIVKFVQQLRPYHFMRYQAALLSNNELYRKIFKLWANVTVALFISDDFLETTSESEMKQVCDAFQFLADQIRKQFPRFPTVAEMKKTLLLQKVDEQFTPHVMFLLDFANNVAKSMIRHGNFPLEDVNDYWRRLVVTSATYYEGVAAEVKHNVVSYYGDLWTRLFQSATFTWMTAQEILSGAVGKTTESYLPLLNELHFLGTFYCMVINDIYSYAREMGLESKVCNIVQSFVHSKEVAMESEAAHKCVQILNAAVKVMYQTIEKTKHENPANQVLWKLLDNISMATAGWYFWHHNTPRYSDSFWRLSFVDVGEDELEEWRKCSDKPLKEVMPLLLDYSPQAKRISDAFISGVVRMHSYLPA